MILFIATLLSHYNHKLMPKWEVNLAANLNSQIVQRQLEQLAEPFGFTKDITPPSSEAPRRRDLIENVVYF